MAVTVSSSKNNDASNCLVCLTHIIVLKCSLCIPIKGFCKHKNADYVRPPKFRIVKRLFLWNCVYYIILVTLDILYITESVMICTRDGRICLDVISECVIVSTALCLSLFPLLKAKHRMNICNSESHLFYNRKYYGVDNIISEKFIKKWTWLNIFICGCELFFSIVFFFIKLNTTCIFRTICLVIGFYAQMDAMFLFKAECFIVKRIYNSYLSSLKEHMMSVLTFSEHGQKISLETRLNRFKHAYMEMMRAVDEVNHFMDPTFIFWSISTCLTLVINIYVAVIMDVDRTLRETISMQLFAYFSIIGVTNVCFDIQGMKHLVSISKSNFFIDLE